MINKMLRPFIVKVSVLGYFPLHVHRTFYGVPYIVMSRSFYFMNITRNHNHYDYHMYMNYDNMLTMKSKYPIITYIYALIIETRIAKHKREYYMLYNRIYPAELSQIEICITFQLFTYRLVTRYIHYHPS